jgi:hypothetical protein
MMKYFSNFKTFLIIDIFNSIGKHLKNLQPQHELKNLININHKCNFLILARLI